MIAYKQYIINKLYLGTLAIVSFLLFACQKKEEDPEVFNRKQLFTEDWKFYKNDTLNSLTEVLNSEDWRPIDVPHDWSIHQEFDKNSAAGIGGGALSGGVGYYKKSFNLPLEDSARLYKIQFDGVYQNSEVWINGSYLGKRPNGYIGFEYDLTPYLHYGSQDNTIVVKADNSDQPNSRWYSGSGIYRNVWLKKLNKIHIPNWGTFITTPSISKEKALVNITAKIKNEFLEDKEIEVQITIFQDDQEIVKSETSALNITTNSEIGFNKELTIYKPKLWSIDSPWLYKAQIDIIQNKNLIDRFETRFGIRDFKFDLEKGFKLNGESLKIRGVCMHHDLGPLGAAINTRAIERQLEILKEMGVNGIRTAHNPPAPELLDLCDQMGFIVMDEAFDIWRTAKTKHDYSQYWDKWHEQDIADLIKRDRNHPSVFLWSIGNEIQEQWSEKGEKIGVELSNIVKSLDSTRPVTAGMNPPVHVSDKEVTIQFEETADKPNSLAGSGALDVIGYNYAHQTWEKHQLNFPNTPFIATETTSGLQTRGYYEFPSDTTKIWPVRWDKLFTGGNPDHTISAFDQVRAPWGSLHETSWKIIKKNDFLSGFFIWTGFDYIGEPTPYEWPSRSSYFGIVDLAGFPKDVYYMYKSEWTDDDVLHLLPHWNWEQGQTVDVWAYYNNADEVELFLNGESRGTRSKKDDELHVMWRFPFESGTLKAISRKNGQIVKETEIRTASKPAKLELFPDRKKIRADGLDLSFITVTITDAEGTIAPRANNQIDFEIEGPGEIVGVSSGDPTNHESFKGKSHRALNGKCLVIVQSTRQAGEIKISANSAGLESNSAVLISH
ncbi:beta-galactosidase GalB [Zunongwangia profunda]|nr:beta-galactosidase GalB [Zunongwangia profunda]MAS70334.1 glycoside hydrolase family 2 [Zunongwangia sp.]|tara:strand:- start:9 stop:2510 length:2502 start_codon:yes stop_codon:yes gene_type:complete